MRFIEIYSISLDLKHLPRDNPIYLIMQKTGCDCPRAISESGEQNPVYLALSGPSDRNELNP